MDVISSFTGIIAISIVIISILLFWYLSNIKRFRPDQIVSISSYERRVQDDDKDILVRSRIITGGGSAFINPLTQRYYLLSTNINFVTIACERILTGDDLLITANATLTFSIDDSDEINTRKAFNKFGKYAQTGIKGINSEKKIREIVGKIFEVGIREIIGKMSSDDLKSDSEGFSKKSQKYIEIKLQPLGLIIHNTGIKNIEYLDDEFEKERLERKKRKMIEEYNKTREVERVSERAEKEHQSEMKLEDMKQQFKYEREVKIKEKESEKKIKLEEQELEEIEEKHRIQISSLKKERLEAEEGVLAKEEESTQNLQLIKKRSKANVAQIISRIKAETAQIKLNSKGAINYYNAQQRRDIELMNAYTRYESLEAEARGQEKLIQAMNQASTGAILQSLVRQNPELIENTLEKLLGKDGMAGIAKGITKHLSNIESIRITDLGGGNGSDTGGGIERLAELPPKLLLKFITTMNTLDLGEILEKFGISSDSFDHLVKTPSDKGEKYKEKVLDKKDVSTVAQKGDKKEKLL